jgi:hypothetical protein
VEGPDDIELQLIVLKRPPGTTETTAPKTRTRPELIGGRTPSVLCGSDLERGRDRDQEDRWETWLA